MMDSANPLEGWPLKEVLKKAPSAKNDIYGSLFLHVQEALLKFYRRLKNLKVRFQLFQVNAVELPGILQQRGISKNSFDRIEVRLFDPKFEC
jgi:hypothetical protein